MRRVRDEPAVARARGRHARAHRRHRDDRSAHQRDELRLLQTFARFEPRPRTRGDADQERAQGIPELAAVRRGRHDPGHRARRLSGAGLAAAVRPGNRDLQGDGFAQLRRRHDRQPRIQLRARLSQPQHGHDVRCRRHRREKVQGSGLSARAVERVQRQGRQTVVRAVARDHADDQQTSDGKNAARSASACSASRRRRSWIGTAAISTARSR